MPGDCVAVDCGIDVCEGGGELCSDEHDKRENVKAIANRKILVCTSKELAINLLLTDRIFQCAQSFNFNHNFISVL